MFRFLISILGFIFGSFRRSSRTRNINRWLDDVDEQNAERQAVREYTPCPVEAFVPQTVGENIIVSGINGDIRNRVICSAVYKVNSSGAGAIVIHSGNLNLTEMITNTFHDSNGFYCIGVDGVTYDPLVDMNKYEISQFIMNSSSNEYRIERRGGSFISGIADYLYTTGRSVGVSSFADCLENRTYEQLYTQVENRQITDLDAQRINSELAQGQSEIGNIEKYFYLLERQGLNNFANEHLIRSAISIKKALRNNQVIVINIGNASNDLLLNILIQEIKDSLASGFRFVLATDSIPLSASDAFKSLLQNFTGNCSYVYSSSDVYADTQGSFNLFDTLIGRASSVMVLRHYSAIASQKFSEFFGEYQKIEIYRTVTSGDSYGTYGQVLPGSNYGDIYHPQYVYRRRVDERELSLQDSNHIFIKQAGVDEIVSVQCVHGDARTTYEMPRASRRIRTRTHSRHINWWVFILLFLIATPVAFIYSFIKSQRNGKIASAIFFVLSIAYYIVYLIENYSFG